MQPGWAKVLTPSGISLIDEVSAGSTIWSGKKWVKILDKDKFHNFVYGFYTLNGWNFTR